MGLLEVDGSFGEGGGQILRSAVALSAILGKGVAVKNIRKSRPRPGLGIQHIKSIELARDICDADVKGLFPGSTEIQFIPGTIKRGHYSLDIGTAGSITLALQSVMPIACFASGQVTLEITGGTDVKWSPPYDYFHYVTLPALRRFGIEASSTLVSRGYFPVGNGKVILSITPSRLHGTDITRPTRTEISGISASSRLPLHVAERQAKAASQYLASKGVTVSEIRIDSRNDLSTGSSITLYSGFLGSSALGERGLPAENVGRKAAEYLYEELASGAAVDEHLSDQLIIFMGLAKGRSSFTTSRLSSHASTNLWVVEQMLNKKFEIVKNKNVLIRCE
jgi:RNA 3'-terminal phosphate cyclase (ATP)